LLFVKWSANLHIAKDIAYSSPKTFQLICVSTIK